MQETGKNLSTQADTRAFSVLSPVNIYAILLYSIEKRAVNLQAEMGKDYEYTGSY